MKLILRNLVITLLLCGGVQAAWAQVEVTIDEASGQNDPVNSGPIVFSVTFEFDVTGFDETDVDLSTSTAAGTLVAVVTEIAPDDYEVSITGMTGDGNVIITIAGGAASRISNGDLTDPSTNADNSVTYDTTAPTLDALTPADDATGVAQNANLVLDFDEQIDAGTGVVNLRRYSDDAVFDSFTMPSDPSVSIVGSIATLNPFGSLVSGVHYYVEVPAGAFTDEAGNPFAGFSTKDDWDFTVDTVPPNITGYDNNPACVGETLVISGTNFGLSTPTVTINGVNASVNSHTTTTITITVPNTTTGTVEVTNNDIGESDTSNSLVLTPGPNTGLNVVESATSVITGGSVSITVQSSESGVDYRLQRVSPGPITTVDGPDPGPGNLVFSTGALSPAGSYQFRIRAQAGSCNSVNLTDMVTISVFDFSADAGPDYDICQGDSVFLGGSPTVVGGSGFNEFTWTSNPAGTPLTSSNPKVKPSVTTSYYLRVEDSDGNIARDTAVVTVRPRTPASDLDILFDPDKVAFAQTDDPVNLSFTVTGGSTGTGIFSGPAVNPALDRFYPANAPVGDNTIQLDFTNQDNCVTAYTEIVQVYNPNDYLLVLQDYYCPEGTEDLDIVVPVGYTLQDISLYQVITFFGFKFIFPIADGTSWTKNVPARDVQMDLTALPQGDLFFRISYSYLVPVITYIEILPGISIPIITYVPTTVTVDAPFRINSPPTVTIQSRSSTDQFCANAPVVQLLGKEPGGTWQGPGVVPDFGNDGNPAFGPGENGQATFTPANANIGLNTLIYTFEDEFGCTSSASIDFTVFAIPEPDFSDIDGCVGIPLDFAVTNTTNGTVSKGWRWTFDDGTSLEGLGDPINPTSHTYSTANDDYDVVLTVFTMDGCQNEVSKSISVGAIPDVAFEWENVCRDERAALNLNSTFVANNPSRVDTIRWFFGDGNSVYRHAGNLGVALNETYPGGATAIGTIGQPRYDYDTVGGFNARVEVITDLGCVNRDTAYVYKVPTVGPVTNQQPYDEDFADALIPWVKGGTNTSWQFGSPAAPLISADAGGNNAWVTNLTGAYNADEDSWVHSPCFDLSQLQRPVYAMDMRTLTLGNIDGAVLQMNYTNTTDNEGDWVTIGNTTTGKNWYDQSGIASNPGNQALNQYGWSGRNDQASWRRAVIALDGALSAVPLGQRDRVRFRIAFSSSSFVPNEEGFGFDNVLIAQRDRVVLVEQFVNSGGIDTPSEPNKVSNNSINTFINNSLQEAIKLEYHTGLVGPNDDPIYKDNTVDANARAAFYGVTSAPYTFIDAQTGNVALIFSSQTLKPAEVTIDTIFTLPTPAETFNVQVTFTAKADLPANTVLHVAVIEKVVNAPAAMGTNGESAFQYVMKKLLPNALGTRFATPISSSFDSTRTVNVSWSPEAYDFSQLAVIAFVQNEDTREIYQSRILESPLNIPIPSVVTGVEPSVLAHTQVYPNPADEQFTVRLQQPARTDMPVLLVDNLGREQVAGVIAAGDTQKSISTAHVGNGAYMLVIRDGGAAFRTRMIIGH